MHPKRWLTTSNLDFEIIVVDDTPEGPSGDGTADVCRKLMALYPEGKIVSVEELGHNFCRNC